LRCLKQEGEAREVKDADAAAVEVLIVEIVAHLLAETATTPEERKDLTVALDAADADVAVAVALAEEVGMLARRRTGCLSPSWVASSAIERSLPWRRSSSSPCPLRSTRSLTTSCLTPCSRMKS
jgi:hypothetical protein